ncbi:hypothetical protein ACLB2K_014085 [Fragaria x ananassa]
MFTPANLIELTEGLTFACETGPRELNYTVRALNGLCAEYGARALNGFHVGEARLTLRVGETRLILRVGETSGLHRGELAREGDFAKKAGELARVGNFAKKPQAESVYTTLIIKDSYKSLTCFGPIPVALLRKKHFKARELQEPARQKQALRARGISFRSKRDSLL